MSSKIWLIGLMVAIAFLGVSCGKSREFQRHVWPGPIQAFEGEEDYFVFLEFLQVFTPVKKEGGGDHPKGRQRGSYFWKLRIPKNGAPGEINRMRFNEIEGVSYGMTFHPNLAQIFWYQDSWYVWRCDSREVERSLFVFKEETVMLIDVEDSDDDFLSSLLNVEGDHLAHRRLGKYEEVASRPHVLEESTFSNELVNGAFFTRVSRLENAYELQLGVVLEGEESVSVELEVPEGYKLVTESEIDALPIRPAGKLKS